MRGVRKRCQRRTGIGAGGHQPIGGGGHAEAERGPAALRGAARPYWRSRRRSGAGPADRWRGMGEQASAGRAESRAAGYPEQRFPYEHGRMCGPTPTCAAPLLMQCSRRSSPYCVSSYLHYLSDPQLRRRIYTLTKSKLIIVMLHNIIDMTRVLLQLKQEPMSTSLYLRLRHHTLLVLLTPPIPRHTPRLVHVQHLNHQQYQQADTGMKEFARQGAPQRADISTFRFSRDACQEAHCLHVLQQDAGGNHG